MSYRGLRNLSRSLERLTNSNRVMDNDHNYIHEGRLFIYNEKFTSATTVAKAFSFITPTVASNIDIHYRPVIATSSGDKVDIELYEGATLSANGTDMKSSVINCNRQSSKTTQMQTFYSDSTISSAGTLIKSAYIPGGTGVGGTVSGGSIGVQNEILLKQNTLYVVKVINGSGDDNTIHLQFQWYEEKHYNFS